MAGLEIERNILFFFFSTTAKAKTAVRTSVDGVHGLFSAGRTFHRVPAVWAGRAGLVYLNTGDGTGKAPEFNRLAGGYVGGPS